jgi:hypothetical protein
MSRKIVKILNKEAFDRDATGSWFSGVLPSDGEKRIADREGAHLFAVHTHHLSS